MSGAANNNNPRTLTITDIVGTNISTDKNDYVIGKITWVNLATYNTDLLNIAMDGYDGSKWTTPEGGTSTLKIVADFNAVIAAPRSRNPRHGR